MRNNAYEYTGEEEYSCIPYMVKLDRQKKAARVKKELREACNIVSFVWIIILAFLSQIVIPQSAIADIFSSVLMLSVILQAIGNK